MTSRDAVRWLARHGGLAWVVAVGMASPAAGRPQDISRETSSKQGEKTGVLPTREGLRLRLVTPAGHIRILTRDSGPAEVRYRVWGEGEPAKHAGEFAVSARGTPEGVSINGVMPGGHLWSRLHYEVTVPRSYNLDVSTHAGAIRIEDIDGQATLYSAGGDITAGRIGGAARLETMAGRISVRDVRGNLHASTGGGDVSAGQVQGEAVLRSAGGDISVVSVQGPAQLETAGGNIYLRHAGSTVTASTAGGRIDLGETSGVIKARTAGGSIRVLRLAGSTQLETAGGSIYLASVEGPVRATTTAGSVTAWLAGKWQGASQLETGAGPVAVYIPRELPVKVEASIEAGGHRIDADADLPLKILSGSEADARGVRAEAALNGGGDVLRIKVGSGNIKLKFSDAYRSYYEQVYKSLMQQMEERQERLLERQRESLEREQRHLEEMQEKLSGMEEFRLRLEERLVGRIPVDAEVQKRKLIYQVRPIYPEIAKRERLEGLVRLEARIDKEGKVERLEVIRGNPVLAQAALEAVRQWRYAPAFLGSKPVAVTTVIQVEFRLE